MGGKEGVSERERDSGRTSTRRTSKGHIRGNQKKEVEIIENPKKDLKKKKNKQGKV